jgi:hypothetical protein
MSDTEYYRDSQGREQTRKRTSSGDVSDAQSRARMGTTAGAGLGNLSDDFKPPKQNPGEGPADYGRRVAQAREAHRQRKAMR